MESKKQKSWGNVETSILFHLVNWGYDNKMAAQIAAELIPERTRDGLHGKISDVRKYLSNEKGYRISNYGLSGTTEKHFKNSGKIEPSEQLLKHKPATKWDFIPMVVRKEVKGSPSSASTGNGITIFEMHEPTPHQQAPVIIDQQVENKDPDIIDVMRMAKELGAAEVEYQGMKIKF